MDRSKREYIITTCLWWALLMLPLFILLFNGCSDDDNVPPTNENNYITISPYIDAGATRVTGNSFEENDAIGLYVVPYENNNTVPGMISNSAYEVNAQYIYRESAWSLPSGNKVPWPADSANVDLYAYYPFDVELNQLDPVQYPFSVQPSQTTKETYEASDFLWSKTENVVQTRYPVALTFSHRLSKVRVNVTTELTNIEEYLRQGTVSILGVNQSGIVNLADGSVAEAVPTVNADIVTFRYVTPSPNYMLSTEGIIIPQTAQQGERLIRIELANGTRYHYSPETEIVFSAATERNINITITRLGISVEVNDVSPWQPSPIIEGDIGTPIPRVLDLQAIDWDQSFIHHVYSNGVWIADVCREFIRTGTGSESGVQAMVIYQVDDLGSLDTSTGFVPQEMYFYNPQYAPISLNRHGGRVNWTPGNSVPSYVAGTSAPITRVLFNTDGSIAAAPQTYPVTLQTAPYVLTDIDNNEYALVKIGSQYWMKENLRTTRYNNGVALIAYNPQNDEANVPRYGKLYTWDTMMDANSIAPEGWRTFSSDDFNTLYSYILPYAGRKLKSNYYWITSNYSTDITGFSGLGAGIRLTNGTYNSLNDYGYWWTTTRNGTNPTYHTLYSGSISIGTGSDQPMTSAMSVRLIRED